MQNSKISDHFEKIYHIMTARKIWISICHNRFYKFHELAQASLLWGTVTHVSDVAHGPLVLFILRALQSKLTLQVTCFAHLQPLYV